MTTLFVNRLTVIDASLLDPDRGLLGQSWLLDVEIEGTLDRQGMVLDFAEVKRRIKSLVDQEFDHRLLVPTRHPGFSTTLVDGGCHVRFRLRNGEMIDHRGPADACALLDAGRVDSETLGAAISARLEPQLPENILAVRLLLHTEAITDASYHYSHGLKLHRGNCQRIAHGHRSRIQIYRDGARDKDLEADWAERWRDVYIASRDDLLHEVSLGGNDYLQFGYRAAQGRFELRLPRRSCRIVDCETTVENLARHIRATLEHEHPGSTFRVVAFEGVEKGAISEGDGRPST
ncbi:MAG: 6-carboxytetrahydropterin synthase [Gammaproteobacteria bacterium]|nr:6-carboxytetrahydropterin synthase [Gammaproteobacteria bacterium]